MGIVMTGTTNMSIKEINNNFNKVIALSDSIS